MYRYNKNIMSGISFEIIPSYNHGMTKIPDRLTKKSANYTFYSPITVGIAPGSKCLMMTNITVKIPISYALMITSLPNSEFDIRSQLIDSNHYPKEIGIFIHNCSNDYIEIYAGDPFANGLFIKHEVVDDVVTALPDTTVPDSCEGTVECSGHIETYLSEDAIQSPIYQDSFVESENTQGDEPWMLLDTPKVLEIPGSFNEKTFAY
jgi:dUTPase